MTIGVGGKTKEQALSQLTVMNENVKPISLEEFKNRILKAQAKMHSLGIDAIYLDAGTNLTYFSGLKWYKSERLVGAILPAKGEICYIAPHFEQGSLEDYMVISGQFFGWHEHQSPYCLVGDVLKSLGLNTGKIALDPSAHFFLIDGLIKANQDFQFINGDLVCKASRECKSVTEIKLMQTAKDMPMAVHQATASMLTPGISTTEVAAFINQAHKKVGAAGSSFCIVLFGEATSFPHGVKEPQILKENDWVLIDTGCIVEGYHSDITRTYAYGKATNEQRIAWQVEKDAQLAAFEAAKLGQPCELADYAAREVLQAAGFGPDYQLPGLPHRTGHGCGMDIHESPYLVRGDKTPLEEGMVFSNEPMLVIPGKFGVRLEDHFYMSSKGPVWFTQPAYSVDDPFALDV